MRCCVFSSPNSCFSAKEGSTVPDPQLPEPSCRYIPPQLEERSTSSSRCDHHLYPTATHTARCCYHTGSCPGGGRGQKDGCPCRILPGHWCVLCPSGNGNTRWVKSASGRHFIQYWPFRRPEARHSFFRMHSPPLPEMFHLLMQRQRDSLGSPPPSPTPK